MRLSPQIAEKLVSLAKENFGEDCKLYLFGSRVDDSKKGGDIDLLLLTNKKITLEEKWAIKRKIHSLIGEQKIDIVNFTHTEEDTFKDIILEDAILL